MDPSANESALMEPRCVGWVATEEPGEVYAYHPYRKI